MGRACVAVVLVIAAVAPHAAARANAPTSGAAPQLSISDASVLEGDRGTRTLGFDVTLSAPSATLVSVAYATSDDWQHQRFGTALGTASVTSGADYESVSGTLTFPPGVTSALVPVTVFGDTTVEPDERFTVKLSDPSGATLEDAYGTGTILNDDRSGAPALSVGAGDVSIRQPATGSRVAHVPVTFSAPMPASSTLTFETRAASAVGVGPAGTAGDFRRAKGSYSIPAGVTATSIPITILADPANAASRTFQVIVTSSLGTVTRARSTVTVRSDAVTGPARTRDGGPPRIALYGDSLTADYTDVAKPVLEALGYAVDEHGVQGSGILDADQCTGAAAAAVRDGEDPDVVIFETVGDYGFRYPPCDSSVRYGTPAFFQEWQQVATTIATVLTAHGAQLHWMLAPQTTPGRRHDVITGINEILPSIAAEVPGMTTIDAFTAFGGDPPDCSLRFTDCLHLSPEGRALMTELVLDALTSTGAGRGTVGGGRYERGQR